MKKSKYTLAEAINEYDESSPESFRRLKDIVCTISEERMTSDGDYILDYLLNVASNKMRVFGYSIMNGISKIHNNDEQFNKLSDEILKAGYTSESGTLLDYNQYKVLDTYNKLNPKIILLSAPTSFGKTRLLQEIIFNNRDSYKMILLIFPTNSLLFENYSMMVLMSI